MPDKYVLIDFENVQPRNLDILVNTPFKVFVFTGANQTKVSFDTAAAMQSLGNRAKYIKISGNGPNALDFHIAYYIGEFAAKDPKAHFHVISKDRGFDPLIAHLRGKKVRIQREKDLAEIPELRLPAATSSNEKIDAIVKNLVARAQSRPRKVKTLSNTIRTLFTDDLADSELDALIKELQNRKYIVVKQNSVTYKLPK